MDDLQYTIQGNDGSLGDAGGAAQAASAGEAGRDLGVVDLLGHGRVDFDAPHGSSSASGRHHSFYHIASYLTIAPTVYFYALRDAYGCFSNFSPHGVKLRDVWWPTSEHYFQAQKFVGMPHEEAIRLAKTPKQAAEMGRDRKRPLRDDWEQVKDDTMREAVRQKFSTHKDIQQILLATGDEELVENAPSDYYWGIGADGSGKNMLGKILMEVRSELRDERL